MSSFHLCPPIANSPLWHSGRRLTRLPIPDRYRPGCRSCQTPPHFDHLCFSVVYAGSNVEKQKRALKVIHAKREESSELSAAEDSLEDEEATNGKTEVVKKEEDEVKPDEGGRRRSRRKTAK